ncbi:hypothetical protein, partial [Dokdonella immobilis]
TFAPPMRDVTSSAEEVVSIWPYAEEAMAHEFPGVETSNWNVEYVYEDPSGSWQHVLINTEIQNAYLVVVIDINAESILGYHFLNLNEKYGLSQ